MMCLSASPSPGIMLQPYAHPKVAGAAPSHGSTNRPPQAGPVVSTVTLRRVRMAGALRLPIAHRPQPVRRMGLRSALLRLLVQHPSPVASARDRPVRSCVVPSVDHRFRHDRSNPAPKILGNLKTKLQAFAASHHKSMQPQMPPSSQEHQWLRGFLTGRRTFSSQRSIPWYLRCHTENPPKA